jgi:hypothetical protein
MDRGQPAHGLRGEEDSNAGQSPEGEVTGREVAGLHESLMETAPGGEDAARAAGWF